MKSSTYLLIYLFLIVVLDQLYKYDILDSYISLDSVFIAGIIIACSFFITIAIEKKSTFISLNGKEFVDMEAMHECVDLVGKVADKIRDSENTKDKK